MQRALGVSPAAVRRYVLATGLVAGLAQVVLFRELLVVATGTELVIGLLVAVWLVAGAVGSVWADRGPQDPGGLVLRAWRLSWAAATSVGLGVLVVRGARPVLSALPNALAAHLPPHSPLAYLFGRLVAVQPGEAMGLFHVIAVAGVATALPAFVCGAQFVTAARLLGGGRGAVVAYAVDAIGHLLGGVALAFAATVWLDGMVVAAGVAVVAVAAGVQILPPTGASKARLIGVGAGAVAMLWLLLMFPSRAWRSPMGQVLDERAGICGLVTVAEQKGGGVYFFINGVPSGASPPTPRAEVLVNFALAQVPRADRVLLVGGALNGAVAECLKHSPRRVDCVEFDPVVVAMARKWSADADRAALNDPRVRTVAGDPRLLLRRATAVYDAIIISLPPPTTALINRFYSQEWFELCYRRLSPGGVLAFAMPYSQVYRSEAMAAFDRCIVRTALSAAARAGRRPTAALLAGDELVVAVRPGGDPAAQRPEEIVRRLAERGVDAPYLQAFVWDWADDYNVQQAWEMLRGPLALNSDGRPVGYLLGTAFWLAQVTPTVGAIALGPVARRLQSAPLNLSGPAAALAIAMLAVALAGRRRVASVVFMAAAGFAAMAGQLAVLFYLQNVYGYVYGWIGVVTGAFMLGLALGAIAAHGGRAGRLAAICLLLLATTGLAAAVAGTLAGGFPLVGFPAVASLAGAFAGVAFKVAVDGWGGDEASGIGAVYAADLIGGVMGALLLPAFLIPLAGLLPSAVVPALATLPAFVALAIAVR